MKKLILLIALAGFVASCADDNPPAKMEENDLVTPPLYVSVSTNSYQSPLTGVLHVYPCQANGSIYEGNYINGQLTPFPALYTIKDGAIFQEGTNRVLSLPVGNYNLIYWGTPKYAEPIYTHPAIKEPGLSIGKNMFTQEFNMFKISGDTTYYPVYDMVFAASPTKIGSDKLTASLHRVVAGLKVIIKDKNNGILSSSIDSMQVHLTNIATGIYFLTGKADTNIGTVSFPLVRSTDGTEMTNSTVMLFPSIGKSVFKLFIILKNGTQKVFQQTLSTPFNANSKLTLTITLGDIFSDETSGDFNIDNWHEESENIDVPVLD